MQFAHTTRFHLDEAEAIVFDALNKEESVMRTVPPFIRMGSWASIRG